MLSRRSGILFGVGTVAVVAGATFALLAPRSHQPPSLPVVASSVAPPAAVPAQTASPPATFVRMTQPTRVIIPSIGVNAAIIAEGLTSSGTLNTPPLTGSGANDVGWWDGGYSPGQYGPAVLVGHVNSAAMGNLVFANLDRMVAGEAIEVEPGNLWFTVTGTQEVSKNAFPTQAVYGSTSSPTLRLITCGGAFDSASGHYVDNFIVYATESTPSG